MSQLIQLAVCVATQYASAPLLPRGRSSAWCADEQTQRSSSRNVEYVPTLTAAAALLRLKAVLSKTARLTLTFDLLTLKVVSESGVTLATSVPILVFLGLSVFDLGPMYATDRRQTDVRRQTKASLNAPAY